MPMFFPGAPYAGSGTWANRPATQPAAGTLYFATNVGDNGTMLQSNGTRWRPLNGRSVLDKLGAPVTGITGTETLPLQTLVPADLIQVGDTIRFTFALGKSGTTDSGRLSLRAGTAGTTGDTALGDFSAVAVMAASARYGAWATDFKLASATTMQQVGSSSLIGTYGGTSTSNRPAATTISSAAANALYLSIGPSSSGATDTISLFEGAIEWITP